MKKGTIIGSAEAWDNGELGRDEAHVVRAPDSLAGELDDALGMQMISIRLPKELIEEFKMVAKFHKIGYQPLMRDALKRFANSEIKKIAAQYTNEKAAKQAKSQSEGEQPRSKPQEKKAA